MPLQTYYVAYPKELENLSASQKREFYGALYSLGEKYYPPIAKDITTHVFQAFPDIANSINEDEFRGFVEEIVKNIFDAANADKIKNPTKMGVEIKLSAVIEKNELRVKISDNGSGFEGLAKSKKVYVTDYLASQHRSSFFSFLKPKNNESPQSHKAMEKLKGKNYLLGGLGIGLRSLDQFLKKMNGSVKVKNRKNKGASVEISLPWSNTLSTTASSQRPIEKGNSIFSFFYTLSTAFSDVFPKKEEHQPLIDKKTVYKNYRSF